jgi:cell division protein FtsI (penicillin-binding protein 3)
MPWQTMGMVKPRLVREIRDNGVLVKQFKTEILNPMIVSKETLGKAQKMLEGVCERGTARSLQNPWFKIAGKTGTAQVATGQGVIKRACTWHRLQAIFLLTIQNIR